MPTIETPKGNIEIVEMPIQIRRQLRDLLPYGLCGLSNPGQEPTTGIVMQCEENEVYCIKQQPKEMEREGAEQWMQIKQWMIAEAYCRYIQHGFSGAYLASTYIRQRDNELGEAADSRVTELGVPATSYPSFVSCRVPARGRASSWVANPSPIHVCRNPLQNF